MSLRYVLCIAALTAGVAAAQSEPFSPKVLPPLGTTKLAKSLEDARAHAHHLWRDPPPTNPDGTVNAYIEISRGDRQKWELDMRQNKRTVDRMMPESLGGYPVNYGIVPQTVSYDGDPFDALVLGPPIPGGETVRGIIVGLMYMEDEKGLDSKVVLARPDPDGKPLHQLTPADRTRMADYFKRYKEHQAEIGAYSKVPGWGTIAEAKKLVDTTHAFFLKCRGRATQPCSLER